MKLLSALCKSSAPQTCGGCKYLYSEGIGFSDDDRTATRLACALGNAETLPIEIDVRQKMEAGVIATTRCEHYNTGRMINLDVAGRDGPAQHSFDEAQVRAVAEHSGRNPLGERTAWAPLNERQSF